MCLFLSIFFFVCSSTLSVRLWVSIDNGKIEYVFREWIKFLRMHLQTIYAADVNGWISIVKYKSLAAGAGVLFGCQFTECKLLMLYQLDARYCVSFWCHFSSKYNYDSLEFMNINQHKKDHFSLSFCIWTFEWFHSFCPNFLHALQLGDRIHTFEWSVRIRRSSW